MTPGGEKFKWNISRRWFPNENAEYAQAYCFKVRLYDSDAFYPSEIVMLNWLLKEIPQKINRSDGAWDITDRDKEKAVEIKFKTIVQNVSWW